MTCWQYAKIIGESAGFGKKQFAFVMDRFKKLQSGEIGWSTAIREYIKEREKPNECLHCGSKQNISTDHPIPRSKGGPDTADNAVTACKKCNSSKGEKGIYEWFQLDRRYEVPRIAQGKYLKLLLGLHKEKGTLDTEVREIEELCEQCNLGDLCPEKAKLTVYCLKSILNKFKN
nr:HNH endonuclease [Candidatus Njordarchaeota archaeon]